MATIREVLEVNLHPDAVWAAVRDFGAADRLFAGVVGSCVLEGRQRLVTFVDGNTIREVLVTCDDEGRRLVYASVDSPVSTHHNAAFEVVGEQDGTARVLWTTDVLPDELAGPVGERMRLGCAALERALVGDDPDLG